MIIDLVRNWEDHDPVILGHLKLKNNIPDDLSEIDKLWDEFKDSEPEADEDFVDFLVGHGYELDPYNHVSALLE